MEVPGTLPMRILAPSSVTMKKSSYPAMSALKKLHRKLRVAGTCCGNKLKVCPRVALSLSRNPLPSKSDPGDRFISPSPVDSKANRLPSGTAISGEKSSAWRTSTLPPEPPIVHPDKLPVSKSPFIKISSSAFTPLEDASVAHNTITMPSITSNNSGLLLLTTFHLFPELLRTRKCRYGLIIRIGTKRSLIPLLLSQIDHNVAHGYAFRCVVV